ncbi:hypothetical protein C8J56DRAFT_1046289 [Mycena floridula]|nr:hypothetical protein C8J56DRAFT_1046289 [Mycena floridula]
MPSILFVFSSADKNLVGNPAGYYLPEGLHSIDFASPKGIFPVDPASIELWAKDKECIDFLKDQTVKAKFTEAKTLSDVEAAKYDTIPFLLEDKITALGGKYEKAADLFGVKVVVDGNLYTGQNPNSAGTIGQRDPCGLEQMNVEILESKCSCRGQFYLHRLKAENPAPLPRSAVSFRSEKHIVHICKRLPWWLLLDLRCLL